MTPSLIVCLRHGEKPGDAAPYNEGPGLDADGSESPDSLTIRGWQRAGALAGTRLCNCLGDRVPAILVPSYHHPTKHRPYETVYPLAAVFGVTPSPVAEADDPNGLKKAVEQLDGEAVVCWEHKNLATFASEMTGTPIDWPHDRFDVLWLLTPGTVGSWRLEERDQALLAGDKGTRS
jgi:hypothetical protein